jgi:glycosyltransferase involved in cell wall biosynthesis
MTRGRVVQVVRSDGFAGVERYVASTAAELLARNWDVTVIGGDPSRMTSELPAGTDFRPARSVTDVLRALRPLRGMNIVHAHMTAAELPSALLKRRLGGRLVVTRHFAAGRGHSLAGRATASFIRRRLDDQISISRFVADAIGEPSVVIPNGVPPSALAQIERRRVIAVMQRLEREKDTATAIRGWARSGLAPAGWRLIVYGRGSERASLGELTVELGVTDSVEFAGFVNDARQKLAEAEILLATAPREPFGLTVVESMAEGTPVVAADGGAHRETLGEHGLFFAAGDDDGCAAVLSELAGDADRRAATGALLRERHATLFSVAVHVDRLEEVYRR